MNTQPIYKSPAGEQVVMALYERLLARWSVPCETLYVPTRHGQTFVVVSGDKSRPPLVLLHGAGSNSAIWAGDAAEYGRFFHIYAVDLIGEPGKSAPNRPPWESAAYAEWLEDVLNELKIDKTTLVGISQGAWTALKFAIYAPQRAEKLVLISPGGILPDKLSFLLRAIPLSLLGQWGTQRMIRMLFGSQPIPEGVEEVVMTITNNFKGRMGILPIFTDEEIGRLTMPVLLLGGDQDVMRDLAAITTRMKQKLPHLFVNVIQGGGHALLNTVQPALKFLTAENGC